MPGSASSCPYHAKLIGKIDCLFPVGRILQVGQVCVFASLLCSRASLDFITEQLIKMLVVC